MSKGPIHHYSRRAFLNASAAAVLATSASACAFLSTDPEGDQQPAAGGDRDQRESPILAKRVAAGDLPPLSDRLPDEPLMVEPLNRPGRYGGTLRGLSLGPDTSNDLQTAMVPGLFRFSHDLVERTPEVAESFELSPDYRTCTIRFRKGMKWSDGAPMTADDVMCFFEDWQFDQDISPVLSQDWTPGGEPMRVTRVDDYTVRFDFAIPYPGFVLLQQTGRPATPYIPKHFVSKCHLRYNPKAQEDAEEAGFDKWQDWFLTYAESDWGELPPERPVLGPWMPVVSDQQRQRYERNPYYYKVDTDGRQLPYADDVVVDYVNTPEVLTLKVLAGEVSICALSLLPADYSTLKSGEQDSGYTVIPARSCRGAEVAIAFNQEHPDPKLREIFKDVRFRQALSVAIDREQINKLVFFDQSTPRQATVNDRASFFKPEWAEHYAQHDVDLANQLLDEMGLGKDSDGMRLRADGSPLTFQLEFTPLEGPKGPVVELVVQHWQVIGLDVQAMPREKNYLVTRLEGGEHDVSAWHVERQLERAAYCERAYLRAGGDSSITYCSAWRTWLDSGGTDGIEPPAEAKALEEAMDEWPQYEMDTPEYLEAATRVYDLIAENLWVIGTVGQGIAPVMVSNSLENVFPAAVLSGDEDVWWGGDNWIWLTHRAEQWFFPADQ